MSRYIVQPMVGFHGVPYYVVIDTASDKGIEGYGTGRMNSTDSRREKKQHSKLSHVCAKLVLSIYLSGAKFTPKRAKKRKQFSNFSLF